MKISIITATYNSASTIRDTLESIRQQTHHDVEHILVDGGSDDGTVEIIRSYPHVARWISEKDKGIYDAMNKGIRMATGDIIGILNSDDFYAGNTVLAQVARALEGAGSSCLYGDLQYVKAADPQKVVRTWRSGKFRRGNFLYGWMPPHPAFFVKKEVYDEVGLFNTDLKTSSDYEIMLRILYKNRYQAQYIPEVLVKMRTGGMSNASLQNRLRANREDRLAWTINGLHPPFFTMFLKPLRKVSQFIIK